MESAREMSGTFHLAESEVEDLTFKPVTMLKVLLHHT